MTPHEQYVLQEIPIEIQSTKPVVVHIKSLSGNGWNDVGIGCPPEVWQALSNGADGISVRIVSSDRSSTKVMSISPGGTKLWPIESYHSLFIIGGERGAKATVEISFPNAPPGITSAKIIVLKTPADTGL